MRRRGRRRLLRSWGLLAFLLAVATGRAAAERIWEETWQGEGDLALTRDVAIDGRSVIAIGKSSDALLGVGDELGVRAYDLKRVSSSAILNALDHALGAADAVLSEDGERAKESASWRSFRANSTTS